MDTSGEKKTKKKKKAKSALFWPFDYMIYSIPFVTNKLFYFLTYIMAHTFAQGMQIDMIKSSIFDRSFWLSIKPTQLFHYFEKVAVYRNFQRVLQKN